MINGYFVLINRFGKSYIKGELTLVHNRIFIDGVENYLYFTKDDIKPPLNSYVVQGKVDQIFFYTDNKIPWNEWSCHNSFPRKHKIADYQFTREVILTNDSRLLSVESFPQKTLLEFQKIFNTGKFNKNKLYSNNLEM